MRQLIFALAFGMVFFVWPSGAQAQRQNFVCSVDEAGVSVTGSTQVRLTDNGGAFTNKLFEAGDGLDEEMLEIALSAINGGFDVRVRTDLSEPNPPLLRFMFMSASVAADRGAGSVVLFEDSFDGPFPGLNWQPDIGSLFEIDLAVGQPAPSLLLRLRPGFSSNVGNVTTAVNPFNNVGGVGFFVQLALDDPGTCGAVSGAGITIFDQGRNTSRAAVAFQCSSLTGAITILYQVAPGGTPTQLIRETLFLDTGFHDYAFIIAPDRTARWLRDGVQKLATLPGIQILEADLLLKLGVFRSDAAAHFDQVLVTRP